MSPGYHRKRGLYFCLRLFAVHSFNEHQFVSVWLGYGLASIDFGLLSNSHPGILDYCPIAFQGFWWKLVHSLALGQTPIEFPWMLTLPEFRDRHESLMSGCVGLLFCGFWNKHQYRVLECLLFLDPGLITTECVLFLVPGADTSLVPVNMNCFCVVDNSLVPPVVYCFWILWQLPLNVYSFWFLGQIPV